MAETLRYENSEEQEVNEIFFRRTIMGIPSRSTQAFLRNQSLDRIFSGKIVVTPGSGQSFSEDLHISENGENWSKSIDINILPLERSELQIRATPLITPTGTAGKASLSIYGKWI